MKARPGPDLLSFPESLQYDVFIKLTKLRVDLMAWTRILFEQKLKVEVVKEAGGQDWLARRVLQ